MRFSSGRRLAGVIGLAAFLVPELATADWHSAARGRRSRWDDGSMHFGSSTGYGIVKGGGMLLGGSGPSGGYFGFEVGGTAARRFDVGFSVDWFHRQSRDVELLFETDHGFEPPIRGEVTTYESSTDFVPLGMTLRLRMPLANRSIVPFVSGTLAYEILHMEFFERDGTLDPFEAVLGNSETLLGFGWQVAGGVELAVGPSLGIFGEAGMHRSEPSRQLDWGGSPLDVRAPLHGGFMRVGLRVEL